MIDLHAHILPGLDDGPESMEEALSMARIAVQDGIQTLVATPHIMSGVYQNERETIIKAVTELNDRLQEENIPLLILPGSECYLEPDLPECLAKGSLTTINDGGRYLLVELPSSFVPEYTERILYEVQLQGITPIIAHPERNSALLRSPHLLASISSRGVLAQVTTASLLGHFGKKVRKAAVYMLTEGTAQLIGSDAHASRHRVPVISPAEAELRCFGGHLWAKTLLHDYPERIIHGEELEHEQHPISQPFWSHIVKNFPRKRHVFI